MSKEFAKLFDTDRGQIVAMRKQNDESEAEIRLFFNPEIDGLGLCEIGLSFSNDEAADIAFGQMTKELACSGVYPQIDMMRQSFGGDE